MLTIGALTAIAAFFLRRRGRTPLPDPLDGWEAIVVAGCKVRPDGTASPALARRARLAAALWKRGIGRTILLTGAGSPRSEAAAAADVVIAAGVPESAVVLEEVSTSTAENAREAARCLPGVRRVVVVSDDYHGTRCRRDFGAFFPRVHFVGARAPGPQGWWMALRELAIITLELGFARNRL